jgi:pantoate--beta-alanine ligase
MKIENSIKETRQVVGQWKKNGESIGFVPTMGFLHDGHASLIQKARQENDKVVVSIFVNPIQFGPNEDLANYPRDLERDCALCEKLGADLIFTPQADEMYPEGRVTYVDIEQLGLHLCGASREGHFRGVCTVVSKLFHIVTPDRAYFGQKDAQQFVIIKRMAQDLNFPVEIIPCDIVREDDGLAMSSRNAYLNKEQRKAALILSQSLKAAKAQFDNGERDLSAIKKQIRETLQSEPLAVIDYVEIVDLDCLSPITEASNEMLVAIAVFIGKTRLIDNFVYRLENER